MKKKLDASSPYGRDINASACDFYTSQIKPAACMLVKVESQSLKEMVSPKRSFGLKRNLDTTWVELIPRSASGEKFCLEKSSCEGGTLETCSTQSESRSISSPYGINFIDGFVTCCSDNDCTNNPMASSLDVSLDRLTIVTYEMCKSPRRPKFSSSDSKFMVNGESCRPHLSYPTLSNQEEKGHDGSKNKINRMLHNADNTSHNYLPVEVALVEDLVFPTENHARCADNNGYYDTPPISALRNLMGGCCPESVLRSLAMTYENIPSILRERTSRKTSGSDNCANTHTPEVAHVNSLDNLNPKQGGFISFIHKPKVSAMANL